MKKQRTFSGVSHRSSRKGGTVFLFLLTAAAFLLRLTVSFQLVKNDPAAATPALITDMKTYQTLALQILQGEFPSVFYYQPFYYAVFLPLVMLVSKSCYFLAVVQSLLGAGVVWFCGCSARLIAGRRSGYWSALLCTFSAILIYFTPYYLLEILQAFWITLLFYLTLRAWHKPCWSNWLWCGLVLGCSILTRGNTWCFLPVLLGVMFLRKNIVSRKCNLAVSMVVLLVAILLPQLPFSIYNSFRTGELRGPSTAGNAVLAFGNNPEGAPAGLEIPYSATYELWLEHEKEISIPKRMWEWFKEEPAAFLEQQFQKFILFWDATDHPNNITELNALKSPLMQTFRFLPTGVIFVLALAGLMNGFYRGYFRKRKKFLLLWSFIFLYALSIIAFYILARFRLPILPLLCISGGIYLGSVFRKGPFKERFHRICMTAFAIFAVYGLCPLYAYVYEPIITSWTRPAGVNVEFEKPPYKWQNAPGGNYLLVCDHTSALKGGWIGMGDAMTMTKFFRIKKPLRTNRALLSIPVFGYGSFLLSVNGVEKSCSVNSNGSRILMEVPVQERNGVIRLDMNFSHSTGNWSIAMDSRRNYGRTILNDTPVPYESVMFLLIPVEK